MHSERKYLLLHDRLSRAKAQVQLSILSSEKTVCWPKRQALLGRNVQTQTRAVAAPAYNDQCNLITPL
jgi:hypothetical protein